MKLLLNEWKVFLEDDEDNAPENATALWNAKQIENLSRKGHWSTWTDVYKFLGLEYDTNINYTEELYQILEDIEPLTQNKIVQLLGTGTMGVVFELSNNHALKLFREGYLSVSGAEEEMEFYASSKEKLFTKKAKPHTLPVYGYGQGDSGVYWAEMAKLLTLKNYMNLTGRGVEPQLGRLLKSIIAYYTEFADDGYPARLPRGDEDQTEADKRWEIFKRDTMMNIKAYGEDADFTLRELKSLMTTIKSILTEYDESYVSDLHSENIGVLETSTFRHGMSYDKTKIMDPSRTPHFILFDP
jgi:hypothetical protein